MPQDVFVQPAKTLIFRSPPFGRGAQIFRITIAMGLANRMPTGSPVQPFPHHSHRHTGKCQTYV